jgi:hypothetical protein
VPGRNTPPRCLSSVHKFMRAEKHFLIWEVLTTKPNFQARSWSATRWTRQRPGHLHRPRFQTMIMRKIDPIMSYDHRIDSVDEYSENRGRPMNCGEHTCKIISVGSPTEKSINVVYEGQSVPCHVRSVLVRFADVNDTSQTVVDFITLPEADDWNATRYFCGVAKPGDRLPNYAMRKAVHFLSKLGFPLVDGQFPEEAWDPENWLYLDVVLTAQPQRPKATNASQVMDGVGAAQESRIEVKLFSYRPTKAGLLRQQQRTSSKSVTETDDDNDSDVPF